MTAAWTTALSYAVLTIAYLVISQRLCPVVYEKRKALTAITLVIGFTLLAPQLPSPGLWEGLAIKAVYCAAFPALLFAFRVFDQREEAVIRQILQKVFGYVRHFGPLAS